MVLVGDKPEVPNTSNQLALPDAAASNSGASITINNLNNGETTCGTIQVSTNDFNLLLRKQEGNILIDKQQESFFANELITLA